MGQGCTGRVPIMYLAHKPILWVCYVFIMLLVTFGLFGNILSFKILGYNRSRRNQSSTFYLRALAIADSLTLVCYITMMAQQMMLRPALNLHPRNIISLIVGSYPICNIRMYAGHTTTLVSVYIIVLFSIERALVVIDPFRWMRFFSLKKARAAVIVLVMMCALICIPSLFSFNKEYFSYPLRLYNITTNDTIVAPTLLSMANCANTPNGTVEPFSQLNSMALTSMTSNVSAARSLDKGRQSILSGIGVECQSIPECRIRFPLFKRFMLFHNTAVIIVPFIITGLCNLLIFIYLRRAESDNIRKSKANDEQQDRQVTKKLIIVSTAFIVLSFPLAMYHLITGTMSGSYCYTFWANFMTVTISMNAVNFAINFIIYCISEEQFRRLVISVLLCKRHRLKRLLSYINEPKNRGRKSGPPKGHGVNTGADVSSGRKNFNQHTNVTNCSVSQSKDHREESVTDVTDALVHQQRDPVDEAKLEAAAADYVEARHHESKEEKDGENPHDFKNCSFVREDVASELFADDDVDDAKLRALMARWSEVIPE